MHPVSPERSHRRFRHAFQRLLDEGQPRSDVTKDTVVELFRTANVSCSEGLALSITQRAREAGLKLADVRLVVRDLAVHFGHEELMVDRHRFRSDVAATATLSSLLGRLGKHLGNSVRSASFYDTSMPPAESVGGLDRTQFEAVIGGAIEQAVLKKRYDRCMELGGRTFQQTVERYRSGEYTYQELLDHPTYQVGIRTITEALPIDDAFWLEHPDSSEPPERIDASDPDTKTAIRRHLGFVARSEVAHLTELRELAVMSTPDVPEFATRAQEQPHGSIAKLQHFFNSGLPVRLGRLLRVVVTDATPWSFGGAYVGGQLAAIAMNQPGPYATAGLVVLGAIGAGAGIRAVRARLEKNLRVKQRRAEIGAGTFTRRDDPFERQLVPDADMVRQRLLDQAEHLIHTADSGIVQDVHTAMEHLYHTIADVRARLRRSRTGNKPPHGDHHTGPMRIERPAGEPLAHGGPLRIVRPETADDAAHHVEHDTTVSAPQRFDADKPKQDYINFGISNRFVAQQQLDDALAYALSVLERIQPPTDQLKKDWIRTMKQIDQHAEHHMDGIQAKVDQAVAHYETHYTKEAVARGVTAGVISGVAMAALPVPYGAALLSEWVAGRKPLGMQQTRYRGTEHPGYRAADDTGRKAEDLPLPDLADTTAAVRTERLVRTRAERERLARTRIRMAVDDMERHFAETLDGMQLLLRSIQQTGAITEEQMGTLIEYVPALGDIARNRDTLQDLLDHHDEDFTYRDMDADEDSRLAKLVAEVDAIATLGEMVSRQLAQQGNRLGQQVEQVRQYPDDQMLPAARRQQMELLRQQITAIQTQADQFYPALFTDTQYHNLRDTLDQLHHRLDGAMAMITIAEYYIGKVADPLRQALIAAGVMTAADPTQPVAGKERKAARIAQALSLYPASTDGLKALGFIVVNGPIQQVKVDKITHFIQTC